MAATSQWTLACCRVNLPPLYDLVHERGAYEWQTIQFWTAVLTAWAKDKDIASEITSQVPPDSDPTAPERLRRVDFSVDVYDRGNQYHRFPLLYVEGKGAYASPSEKDRVEAQALDACEIYAKSSRGHTTNINCLCVIGTGARAFQYRGNPPGLAAMWGEEGNLDFSQYIDANDPRGTLIWRAFNPMHDTSGIDIARDSDL